MMQLRPFQKQKQIEALEVIEKYGLVYLAMQERTGKTLVALATMEHLSTCSNILIITKKGALAGWWETLKQWEHTKKYTVTNYHQAHKLTACYEGIILDESHNYTGAVPKTGVMYKQLVALTKHASVKLMYISATPHAQGRVVLHPQLSLSYYSPFSQANFYRWHEIWGVPDLIRRPGGLSESYKKCKEDEVANFVSHLFVTGTRSEAGYAMEPSDRTHLVPLDATTKTAYNILTKVQVLEAVSFTKVLVCDTVMRLRSSLHQIEGGTLKQDMSEYTEEINPKTGAVTKKPVRIAHECIHLKNREKIDYILDKWGDSEDVVIMYHYKCEKSKLESVFKSATILQATTNAEGVDLSMYEHLIIYSQDWSTTRYIQRRARQANQNRKTPIITHFLLCKDAISEQVYKTVAVNKVNFTDTVYENLTLN